jgi:hypothetical protein
MSSYSDFFTHADIAQDAGNASESVLWQHDEPAPVQFLVTWDDGHLSLHDAQWVSELYDFADCDGLEGVKSVQALDENQLLVPIRLGEQRRDNSWSEFLVYYATVPIFAGQRRVGTVHLSDH